MARLLASAGLLLLSCGGEPPTPAPAGCAVDNPPGTAWLAADTDALDLGVVESTGTGAITLRNDGDSTLGIEAITVRTASGEANWSASYQVGADIAPPVDALVAALDPGETLVVELTATPESALDLGALLVSTRSASRQDVFRDPVGPVLTVPLIAGLQGGETADLLGVVVDLEQRSITMGESACLQVFATAPQTPTCTVSNPDELAYEPVVTEIAVGADAVRRFDFELGFDVSVPDGIGGRVVPYALSCEAPGTEHTLSLELPLTVLPAETTWEDDIP